MTTPSSVVTDSSPVLVVSSPSLVTLVPVPDAGASIVLVVAPLTAPVAPGAVELVLTDVPPVNDVVVVSKFEHSSNVDAAPVAHGNAASKHSRPQKWQSCDGCSDESIH